MRSPLVVLGLRLVVPRRRDSVWRLIAVLLAGAIAALSAAAMIAGSNVVSAQSHRDNARSPVAAQAGQHAALRWLDSLDAANGTQYPVVYLDPMPGGDLRPPGVRTMPQAGEAVLSPALGKLAESDPAVAATYPLRSTEVISAAGLRGPGEMLAYVRAPAGKHLSGNAVQTVAFGGAHTERTDAFLATTVSPGALRLALFGFIVLPVLVLLVVAARCEASARDRRILILQRLGVTARRTRVVAAIESGILGAAGGVIGIASFWAVRPLVTQIPAVAYPVDPVDTSISILRSIAVIAIIAAMTAVLAAVTSPRLGALERVTRATTAGLPLSRWRLVPLAVGVLICVLSTVVGGLAGGQGFMVGVAIALAGVPLVVGHLVRSAGAAVRHVRTLPSLLAGRRLATSPGSVTRYLAGAMILAFVVVNAQAWISRLTDSTENRPLPQSATRLMSVTSTGAHLGDGAALASASGHEVYPFVEGANGEVLLTDCAGLGRLVGHPTAGCRVPAPADTAQIHAALSRGGGAGLIDSSRRSLGPTFSSSSAVSVDALTATARNRTAVAGFYVFAPDPSAVNAVRRAGATTLVAPYFLTASAFTLRPGPLGTYIVAGMKLVTGFALLAVILAVVDAAFRRRREYGVLSALGARRATMARTAIWETAAPMVVALVPTLALAGLTSWLFVTVSAAGSVSVTYLAQLAAYGLLLAVVGALISAGLVLVTVDAAVRND